MINDRHRSGPASGGGSDLAREAAHLKSIGWQCLEVMELFYVAVTYIASGCMALPNSAGIAGFGEAFGGVGKGCIPTPTVCPRYPDAAL